jgi:hypothetical protein
MLNHTYVDISVGTYECRLNLAYTQTQIFQLYCGGQFYWWRKYEYPEKTTDLPQTLSYYIVSSTPRHERDSNSQH